MPIAPSLAMLAVPGASVRPVPTEIAPPELSAPAPTKILTQDQPNPWQVAPTHTRHASGLVPEAALATAETRSIIPRGRVVVVAAAVVALLMLAAWVLWRPVIHKAARPSSPATTAVEATPPPAAAAAPVVPAACHSRTDSHSGSNACEQVGGARRRTKPRRSKQNHRQNQQTPRSGRAI